MPLPLPRSAPPPAPAATGPCTLRGGASLLLCRHCTPLLQQSHSTGAPKVEPDLHDSAHRRAAALAWTALVAVAERAGLGTHLLRACDATEEAGAADTAAHQRQREQRLREGVCRGGENSGCDGGPYHHPAPLREHGLAADQARAAQQQLDDRHLSRGVLGGGGGVGVEGGGGKAVIRKSSPSDLRVLQQAGEPGGAGGAPRPFLARWALAAAAWAPGRPDRWTA